MGKLKIGEQQNSGGLLLRSDLANPNGDPSPENSARYKTINSLDLESRGVYQLGQEQGLGCINFVPFLHP